MFVVIRTYAQFRLAVHQSNLSVEDVRCENRPTQSVLELIESCESPEKYERFATRYANEAAKSVTAK